LAALLVIAGGLAQMYVTIIGGQAFPMPLFPGKDVSSSFFDGVVALYTPSLPEFLLGIGGVGIALAMTVFAVKVLPFLPVSLADADVDPHHKSEAAKAA
jgi:molybdopterin-containing oxidoreductase family membrane subunit